MSDTAPPTDFTQYTQEEWDWASALAKRLLASASAPVEQVDVVLSVDPLVKPLAAPTATPMPAPTADDEAEFWLEGADDLEEALDEEVP